MANPYEEYFKSIADAIREKFKISGNIYLSQFANKINSSYPLMPMTELDTYDGYIGRVLTATSEAIRSYSGSTTAFTAKTLPSEYVI